MLGERIKSEFTELLAKARNHIARSLRIQTNDDDDEFVRICISGFLENATVEDWGAYTYKFICDAREGEFSESNLREFFEHHWREFGLFHCLFVGYNLGLHVSGKIDDDEFNAYEMLVYPFRDRHHSEIVELFGIHRGDQFGRLKI